MTSGWSPLATKGCNALQVLTARRCFAERILIMPGEYLLRVKPDGEASFDMRTLDSESVRTWIAEMAPRSVEILVAQGEDENKVRSALGIARPRLELAIIEGGLQ